MRRLVAISAIALTTCAPDSEPASFAPSWADDVQAYCQTRDYRWLADLVDRIDRSLPAEFERGSVRFQRMNLQDRLDGQEGTKELQLRLSARRDGDQVGLSAYGEIEPDRCQLRDLEAIEGFDRFDPPMRVKVD